MQTQRGQRIHRDVWLMGFVYGTRLPPGVRLRAIPLQGYWRAGYMGNNPLRVSERRTPVTGTDNAVVAH
jgi:hypothetical protein